MKRIEFLAPVEAMRGDLSGGNTQIVYQGGKRAYDVDGNVVAKPENYNKGYVGAKSFNGKKYFSLKTKTQTAIDTAGRLRMAAFGGACSLARQSFKDLSLIANLQQIFLAEHNAGRANQSSPTRWLQTKVYPMLKGKTASVTLTGNGVTVTINNPWVDGGSGTDVTMPQEVLDKFDSALSAA